MCQNDEGIGVRRKGVSLKANLFIIGCKDAERLRLTLEGVMWSDLSQIDNVVVLVNDAVGRPASQGVKDVAAEFGLRDKVSVLTFTGEPSTNPPTSARGAALLWAYKQFPADYYLKIDDDMLAITHDWTTRLIRAIQDKGVDYASAFTNMNGTCAKRFIELLGLKWRDYSQDKRIPYPDAHAQEKVWQATLDRWNDVVGWQKGFVETLSKDAEYLINANAYCFTHDWLSRRGVDHFDVVGEDERTINVPLRGDTDTFALDWGSLLLHWGFSAAKPRIEKFWPEVVEKLREHWR